MTNKMRLERAKNIIEGIIARDNCREEHTSLKQILSDLNFVLGVESTVDYEIKKFWAYGLAWQTIWYIRSVLRYVFGRNCD